MDRTQHPPFLKKNEKRGVGCKKGGCCVLSTSTCGLAKVMERLVYTHIYNYLIDNNLITSHQSGFTPGDSAVNQLLYITNEFGRALDEGKEVRVVFTI